MKITSREKKNPPHSYPHCWRCDTALLNYATSSWFVSITKIKERLLENAKSINWSPEHIKEGRWGKWLEGARDWSISRQRFWASVMPVWRCAACKAECVFGSASELEEASGKKIDDLHKHVVDEVAVPCACGQTMRRIPDVLDTWFDSGSMPYGERHYPFEKKEEFEKVFPAQFIAEGLDQTRAWFYYLHVLSGAIFEKNAFQNVIVNGIVLAEDGKKMSKKLKNYPDPMLIVEKYGADALRFYLMSSPVVQAENLNFAEKGVEEIMKKNIGRLNNVLEFYKLFADSTPRASSSTHVLDRWIIARLNQLIQESTIGYDAYKLDEAVRPTTQFIDDLSVWYLRRSRDRFKDGGEDATAAMATLRYVLYQLSLVMAPATPFYAEYLFQAIREEGDAESVHLCAWPEAGEIDITVLADMSTARAVVTKALEARDAAKIRVRQPLAKLVVGHVMSSELEHIVCEEVNVKNILIDTNLSDTVELDTVITDELREEGQLRDIVREIQDFRKKSGLKPGEHGTYLVDNASPNISFIKKHQKYLQDETHTDVAYINS